MLVRAWLAHIETHLDHMAVFAQERHAIEHEPEWEQVRASRDAFEAILARRLARGRADRPARALRPAGDGQPHRHVAEARRAADDGADRRRLLQHAAGPVIRPADAATSARCATWTSRPGPRCTARRRPRRRTARSGSTGVLVAELADGIAGLREARPGPADPGQRARARDQGPERLPRPPPPRRRAKR